MPKRVTHIADSKDLLTTGEAAALCSVTPDTVLKWIRAGKIQAQRTPGGHNRIARSALQPIINRNWRPDINGDHDSFTYCWEYNSQSGKIPGGCRDCIVYRSGTRRCYELHDLPPQAGYVGLFCKGTCDQCEYYLIVKDQRPNVLVVTDRKGLGRTIEKETAHAEFNLQVVDCEYKCSMFIENFRPDYVVIDCSLGLERSRQMSKLLYEDPRLPFVRIVLAGGTGKLARECDKMVFATISKRLTASMLLDIVEGDSPRKVEELPQSSEGGRPQAAKGGDARRK